MKSKLKDIDTSTKKVEDGCPDKKPDRNKLLVILLFACLGMFIVNLTRGFSCGFYLEFLLRNNLNKTLGTVSVAAVYVTTAFSSYFYNFLPVSFRNLPLFTRCQISVMTNVVIFALMALIDTIVDNNPSGEYVFALIFVLRGVQGVSLGTLCVYMQGELVDLHLKGEKMLIAVVSSVIAVTCLVAPVMGTQFYITGSWVCVGLGMALVSFIPIPLIPYVRRVDLALRKQFGLVGDIEEGNYKLIPEKIPELLSEKQEFALPEKTEEYQTKLVEERSLMSDSCEVEKLSWSRYIAFYIPDLALLLCNVISDATLYSVPARLVEYNGMPLLTAVSMLQIFNVVCFFSTIGLAYIAEHKIINIFKIMMIGNVMFNVGNAIAFGSTTTRFLFFDPMYQFIGGLIILGVGQASILNLVINCKFELFEKWGLKPENLAQRSAALYSAALNIGSTIGTAVSGNCLSVETEVFFLILLGSTCIVITIALTFMQCVR